MVSSCSVQELVKPGVNGQLFSTAEELADQIKGLLDGFPADSRRLELLRDGIATADCGPGGWSSWQEEWDRVVYPLFASS